MQDKNKTRVEYKRSEIRVEVMSKSLWKDDARDLFQQGFDERNWLVHYLVLRQRKHSKAILCLVGVQKQ